MKINKKIKISYIILFFTAAITLSAGIFFLIKGFDSNETKTLNYWYDSANNGTHYKVYLKPNDFFDTEYLDEGKTYITNLIDHIHIDYNYNIMFDKKISGKYNYYILATVEANKPNSPTNNYWTKEYVLTEKKEITVEETSSYTISDSINIDYDAYNEQLNNFKKSMELSLDGKLTISLIVDSDINVDESNFKLSDSRKLSIPLSELAVEASANSDIVNQEKQLLLNTDEKNDSKYVLFKLIGSCFTMLSILCIMCIIKIHKLVIQKNIYTYTLKKFLNTYDSIIVNVNTKPDTDGLNVINVSSFEELIDAHSEVRMPINYYQDENRNISYFILLNDNTAWQYVLQIKKQKKARHEK